jgi:hypothetical protein
MCHSALTFLRVEAEEVAQGHGAVGAAEYIPFSHSHAVVVAYLGCSRSFLQLLGFQVR